MYNLREYQQEAVTDIINYFKKETKPGIAILPTAAGKSLIIAELIKQMGDPPSLVLQPSKELLEQNYEKYIKQGGEASLYSASVGVKEIDHITYATPGSIAKIPEEFSHIRFVIIDECHLGTGEGSMIDKFVSSLDPSVKVIGLTATPIKLKNYSTFAGNFSQLNILTRMRPKFFSKFAHVTQIQTLYEENFLTPLRYTTYNFDRSALKIRGSDFDDNSASKALQEQGMIDFAINLIRESLKRGKKKILVFTPTVADSYALQKDIPGLEVVSSQTKKKERTAIVDGFKSGRIKVVSNYGTLTTGFDAPELDLIIMLRPTQSYALYYQMLGRGIRIAPGKTVCDVVDLSGNYKVFGDIKDMVIENYEGYGWGMFVKDHLITGIPIGQKINKNEIGIQNEKITFGKYKGMKYSEIPTNYWEWMAKNFDLTSDFSKKKIVPALKALGIDYKSM